MAHVRKANRAAFIGMMCDKSLKRLGRIRVFRVIQRKVEMHTKSPRTRGSCVSQPVPRLSAKESRATGRRLRSRPPRLLGPSSALPSFLLVASRRQAETETADAET